MARLAGQRAGGSRFVGRHDNKNILTTVLRTMADHRMVVAGSSVLVGVSGGVDSVTLLWCLLRLRQRLRLSGIGVAHLHHGLRAGAADEDLRFVERLAESYGLPFYRDVVETRPFAKKERLSLEEAARRLRYDFFERTAAAHGYDKIATAHQADDNAEQVLMALLRGSGPAGLSGIPPVREDRFIRPLIRLTRVEIEAAARTAGLQYVQDASNNDPVFLRNRVRHQLIPYLREHYNDHITATLNRLAGILRREEAWMEARTTEIFSGLALDRQPRRLVLSVPLLKDQPRAIRRRLVRMALRLVKGDLRRVSFERVEAILGCLDGDQPVLLEIPGGIAANRSAGRLVLQKAPSRRPVAAQAAPVFSHDLTLEGEHRKLLDIPEIGAGIAFSVITPESLGSLPGSGRVAFFDLDRLTFPLTIRNGRPGDRFIPLGMTGHQKVKDFFINRKVPRDQRRICPVVVSGGRIVWLAGFRPADAFKVTPATVRVLKAELMSG